MILHFRNRTLEVKRIPVIMGILNMTPDSFSDGGSSVPLESRIRDIVRDGAAILDIGGESTRPGAEEVPEEEELARILPAIRMTKRFFPDLILSADTRKSSVARAALEEGVHIINDVSGLNFDSRMGETIARYRAGAVLMHTRSTPAAMQSAENLSYPDGLIDTVRKELRFSVRKALDAGIPEENLILDPGIGFSKDPEQSAMLIRCGAELLKEGYPLLSGPSRKSFIGAIAGERVPADRDFGTCGAVIASMLAGYSIVRVHNCKAASDALKVFAECMPS